MPRRKKGIRLWLRPERHDKTGVRRATWIILDGGKHIATGCAASEIAAAEAKLAHYIAARHEPIRKERDIEQIDVADVLSIYDDDRGSRQANQALFEGRLQRLNEFWGNKRLADVTGKTCRAYMAHCGSVGGARRDLEDLRAAINHHAKEGYHRGTVRVVLPLRANRELGGSTGVKPRSCYACAGARAKSRRSIAGRRKGKRSKRTSGRCVIWHVSF